MAICFIHHACGEPPSGCKLEILWHEHDFGEYATVGITWEGPGEPPWDYISIAQDALQQFDQAVAWSDLAPALRERGGDDTEDTSAADVEEDDGQHKCAVQETPFLSDEPSESIELYRRDAKLELGLGEWQAALRIFQGEGWQRRPIGSYRPVWFVSQDEGKAMQQAGRTLFARVDEEPGLSASLPIDLGMLYRLTDFVGEGAFVVGKQGAFAQAKESDFSDFGK